MQLTSDQRLSLDLQLNKLKRLPVFCASAMLILVACLQLYRVHAYHLVPWKGGGFGMFASVDAPAARFLRCYLLTAGGEVPVRVPDSLKILARDVRYMPIPERMSHLASQLLESAGEIEFQGVRVEVWRYSFDAQNRQLRANKVTEVTVNKE